MDETASASARAGSDSWGRALRSWWDAYAGADPTRDDDERVAWLRVSPFIGLHLSLLVLPFLGWSPIAVLVALALYLLRMFAITAVFHRLLAHRAYAAPRWLVFLGALIGTSAAQRGPLWWAAHHRLHHRHSDQEADLHAPRRGWLRSHMGWFCTHAAHRTRHELVGDWMRYPELVWLDRHPMLPVLGLAAACYGLGAWLGPAWGTSGLQMLGWGFALSTVLLFHGTFTINSIAHAWGSRPYQTNDDSRNNALLALITLGEGWHNNHHRYAASVRQGFRWYQIDITWYLLWIMERLGLVRGLRGVPERVRAEAQAEVD